MLWLVLSCAVLVLVVLSDLALVRGARRIAKLRSFEPLPDAECVSISIIVPARNEERNLEEAMRSVLALDYPRLEIVAINDRSTDSTGDILDRIGEEFAALRVVHVTELPTGWLGKNHALQIGGESATGEFLLFTDADVVMRPDTLRRVMRAVRERGLDHCTLGPSVVTHSALLRIMVDTFSFFLALFTKPWRAPDRRSRCSIGLGAFNLVRAEAWRAIGGHRGIALKVDDDLQLGRELKHAGFRQELLWALEFLSVEWYASAAEMFRGLEKNAFAANGFSVPRVVAATLLILLLYVYPWFGAVVLPMPASLVCAATVGLHLGVLALIAASHRQLSWHLIAFPVGALAVVVLIWNSTLKTLRNGGISWRGTHYPIEVLKGESSR